MRVCIDGLADPEKENCPTCHGRGLMRSLTVTCLECGGAGEIGKLRCPRCQGTGSALQWIPAPPEPRLVFTEELRFAVTQPGQGDTFDESYAIGVLCALHVAAQERYPGEPDQRAAWLAQIMARGLVVVDLDGIWHSAAGKAMRIVRFGEHEEHEKEGETGG